MSSNQRRIPEQTRAKATCDAILTAAAHVLEVGGETAFTTNRVADRAGVSIGSLYQYYPNKESILVALAERSELDLPRRDELDECARNERVRPAPPERRPRPGRQAAGPGGRPAPPVPARPPPASRAPGTLDASAYAGCCCGSWYYQGRSRCCSVRTTSSRFSGMPAECVFLSFP